MFRNNPKREPSIFNDVLGPVMRGASSSHCAGALRIGRMIRDLTDGKIRNVEIEFDKRGSLATTHKSQGSDMGFFSGLLGYEADDPRMLNYEAALAESGIAFSFKLSDLNDKHPNTYNISVTEDSGELLEIKAVSTGGGAVEIIELSGFEVSISGGDHETLLFFDDSVTIESETFPELRSVRKIDYLEAKKGTLVKLTSTREVEVHELRILSDKISSLRRVSTVLPVSSFTQSELPFESAADLLKYCEAESISLGEAGIRYETARSGLKRDALIQKVEQLIEVMRNSINEGISGADYSDRILSGQSRKFQKFSSAGLGLGGSLVNQIILNVTAVMENKSAMGVFVAAPTAGSCGTLPGTIFAAGDELNSDNEAISEALFAAGVIGLLISRESTFAAEECGCQAETGSAAGMTAVGLVSLQGGTAEQAINAANLALQNTFGLVCDPVANRVEVPCLGKNISAGMNALASANMAIAGFDPVIPLDEVISAWDKTGRSLPRELRCTALGGLSITPTSLSIQEKLDKS